MEGILNLKLLLLGAMPSVLAIIAEKLNPVSGEVAIKGMEDTIHSLVPGDANKTGESEKARDVISQVIARTVDGAAEVAGLIPTWIAVIAGVAGISSEVLSLTTAAVLTGLVASVSAPVLFFLFSKINYYGLEEGLQHPRRFAKSKRELLSCVIIMANVIVIVFALLASLVSTGATSEAAGLHDHDVVRHR